MSFWVAGAVVVGAVVAADSSNKASKRAAKGVKKGLEQSLSLTDQARQDVMKLFNASSQSTRLGVEGAFDFYKSMAPQRANPIIQSNTAAQGVIGQGAQQANNAILGLPVDMGFTAPQSVQYDANYLQNAKLPAFQSQAETLAPDPEFQGPLPGAAPAKKPSTMETYKPSTQFKAKQDSKLKKLKKIF